MKSVVDAMEKHPCDHYPNIFEMRIYFNSHIIYVTVVSHTGKLMEHCLHIKYLKGHSLIFSVKSILFEQIMNYSNRASFIFLGV